MKKYHQVRHHQRQKVKGKKTFVLFAVSFCCVAVCFIVLINTFQVDRSEATAIENNDSVYIIKEQSLINEKEIPAPIINQLEIAGSNAMLARKKIVQPSTGLSTR